MFVETNLFVYMTELFSVGGPCWKTSQEFEYLEFEFADADTWQMFYTKPVWFLFVIVFSNNAQLACWIWFYNKFLSAVTLQDYWKPALPPPQAESLAALTVTETWMRDKAFRVINIGLECNLFCRMDFFFIITHS